MWRTNCSTIRDIKITLRDIERANKDRAEDKIAKEEKKRVKWSQNGTYEINIYSTTTYTSTYDYPNCVLISSIFFLPTL
jgi:hypothetical protein